MKSRTLISLSVIALLTALAIPAQLAAQSNQDQHSKHQSYKLIDMGTLGGPNSYFTNITPGRSLNKQGVATGSADTSMALSPPFCFYDCFAIHAFRWKEGTMIDLGALPGIGASFPNDINASGVVAGSSFNGGYDPAFGLPYFDAVVFKDGSFDLGDSCETYPMPTQMRAFIWQSGVMQDLGTLGGTDSCALFVNDRGQVAGVSFTNSILNPSTGLPTIHPVLWQDGKMMDLGSLGGTLAFANGLNNHGQVAGASTLAGDQILHAFIWENGRFTDLGSLGGFLIEVIGFNEAGEVVGKAQLPDQSYHAFLGKKGGIMDLGTQDANPCSYALQINSKEQIVGYSNDCAGASSHAFLWENGRMTDLNTFVPSASGLTQTEATFINDRGEIATQGVLPNGDTHAVLLIADGDCDDDCKRRIAESQSHAAIMRQNAARVTERMQLPLSPIERMRNQRRQRHHVPGQPTGQRD